MHLGFGIREGDKLYDLELGFELTFVGTDQFDTCMVFLAGGLTMYLPINFVLEQYYLGRYREVHDGPDVREVVP